MFNLAQLLNEKIMKKYLFILAFLPAFKAESQELNPLKFSAYVETYYGFDFAKPQNHQRPSFLYSHKRHNEVNVNLAYVKAAYDNQQVRANLALMTGNYAQYNLAAEPSILQNIYEANIGVKLSKNKNIWLDAGVMPSHIGFESAISADCWTLSRSLMAENSPYFETGVKISGSNEKGNFTSALLLLNGWQRIQRPDGFNRPAIGLQFSYKPKSTLTLNYSNFIGSDKPDSLQSLRIYNNFYAIYEPNENWGVIAGFDSGMEQNNGQSAAFWSTPVLIFKKKMNNKSKIALRGEFFQDKKQVIVSTNSPNGFRTFSASLGYDYQIQSNALFRIEGRFFNSKDAIFNGEKRNFSLLSSLSMKF